MNLKSYIERELRLYDDRPISYFTNYQEFFNNLKFYDNTIIEFKIIHGRLLLIITEYHIFVYEGLCSILLKTEYTSTYCHIIEGTGQGFLVDYYYHYDKEVTLIISNKQKC